MKALLTICAFAITVGGATAIAGCTGDDSTPHDTPKDAGTPDTNTPMPDSGGGGDAGDSGNPADSAPTCFMNPHTHVEIINACTDAQAFDKNPRLPLLLPDGSLPPLP